MININGISTIPCPIEIRNPAVFRFAAFSIVTANKGPGIITPVSEIRTTDASIPAHWSAGDLNATRLEIGTAASTIGHEAFSGCSNITGSLVIPDFTEDIGRGAFKNCWGFEGRLYLHDYLKDVNRETFYNCSGFNGSLYLGTSISGISRQAFYNCTGLNGDLVIPRNISAIGLEAFGNCSGFNGSITISSDDVISSSKR